MKGHILVCGAVHPDGMALLADSSEYTSEVIADDSAELARRLPDADGLVIRISKMDSGMLDNAPRLKVVSRHGVGCDNVPVDALTARGIPVMITGNANSDAVAEHAIFMLLALARKGVQMDRAVRGGDWKARLGTRTMELAGRRLLVVGCGRIGRAVVAKARALGMEVAVHDPFVDEQACDELGAAYAPDLNAGLAAADAVTLHLPSTGEPVIGAEELALLPDHALVVNLARGDLVDEEALAAALAAGSIAGAGVDVYSQEPPPADHPLLGLENVLLSPHSAALTDESKRRMGMISVQNAMDVLAGSVDETMVFNPGWKSGA